MSRARQTTIWSLRTVLIASTMSATAMIVMTIALLEEPLFESRISQTASDIASEVIDEVEVRLEHGDDADVVADALGASHGARVWITKSGNTIGDTATNAPFPSLEDIEPWLPSRQAIEGAREFHLDPEVDGHRAMWVATEQLADGVAIRVEQQSRKTETIRQVSKNLTSVAGVLALIVGLALTITLSRSIVEPARELTEVAAALARGDLSVRTNSQRIDELGAIGRSLDGLAEELTQRIAALNDQELRLKRILDSMIEGVFVTDREGRVVLSNRALDAIADGQPVGRSPNESLRSTVLRDAVHAARGGAVQSVEVALDGVQGKRVYKTTVASLNNESGVVGVLHDISEQKATERLRRDFVANASHELRTPLTAIRGFAETLHNGALHDAASAERFVGIIIRHAMRLQALVDDLLALSRAESPEQEYELEELDIGAAIDEVVLGLDGQARARHIRIEVEPIGASFVVANHRALDQVLVNLIDNAIKYTPEQGTITLRAFDDLKSVVFEISNTGPGIPKNQLARIFERFYRVDAGRARESGGTGLGLSIVRHLLARMGATIEAASVEGESTTFRVHFGKSGVASTKTLPPPPYSAAQ